MRRPPEQACDDSPYEPPGQPEPDRQRSARPRASGRREGDPRLKGDPRSDGARTSAYGRTSWTPRSCCPTRPRSTASTEHEVVLPLVVITELEGKRHHPELGWFARQSLRMLDELRIKHGRLDQPVPTNDVGGTLRVELNHADDRVLPPGFRNESNDARILSVALSLAAEGRDVTLVSKDMPLRVKAASVGLRRRRVPARPGQRPDLDRHGRARRLPRKRSASCTRARRSTSTARASCPATPAWCCTSTRGSALGRVLPGQVGAAGPRRPGGVRPARPLGRAADRAGPAARRVDRHRLAGRAGRHRQVGAGAVRRASRR